MPGLDAAVSQVVEALHKDPDAINSAPFAALKDYLESVHGCTFGKAKSKKSAAAKPSAAAESASASASADPNEINPDTDPDPDRWPADNSGDALYVAITGAGSEDEAQIDNANAKKAEAQELANNGDVRGAIKLMNEVLRVKPSAMNYAFRASLFLKLKTALRSAIKDADAALALNPESARAARVRGIARRHLGEWVAAADDLNHAQQVDFNTEDVPLQKFLTERSLRIRQRQWHAEQEAAEKKAHAEAKAAAAAAHRKKQEQEEAEERAARGGPGAAGGFHGGMPGMGGGMPGGMGGAGGGGGGGAPGGMGGLEEMIGQLLSDPEIQPYLAKPGVAQKLQSLFSGGGNPMAAMSDPDLAPIVQKLMAKMMGGGGMPGMGGGMPGMGGGMPGMGGGMPGMGGGMPGMGGFPGMPGMGAGTRPGGNSAAPGGKPAASKPKQDLDLD